MIDQCVDANVAPAEKYKVVFSGMDLEPFLTTQPDDVLREKLNIPKGATVVGAIARLFPLKGYEYFIPLAIRLAKKYNDIHFLIIGNGEMREDIDKMIAKEGVSDRFSFSGLVPPSEIYRYTALMNMLVHLSMREGLPRTVVQALASGKPAIGFNLDGTPEVILNGKTGYIVEAKDVDGVEKAIDTLYNDSELAHKMGMAGRELVKENFDWHLMSDVLEEEYKKGIQ
jgi:glycosyltransferase involved in cell wall biosynthesis